MDLGIDGDGVRDAALPGDPELPAEGLGVVKEDEAGLAALPIGEVPGAEGLGEEDRGSLREERLQLLAVQGASLAAGQGRGKSIRRR